MNPTTPTSIIWFVIATLAGLAFVVIGTLCGLAVAGTEADGEFRAALIGFAGGLVGALSSVLVNTRTSHGEQRT